MARRRILLMGAGRANLVRLLRARANEDEITLVAPHRTTIAPGFATRIIEDGVEAARVRVDLAVLAARAGARLLTAGDATADVQGFDQVSPAPDVDSEPAATAAALLRRAAAGEIDSLAVAGTGPTAPEIALSLARRLRRELAAAGRAPLSFRIGLVQGEAGWPPGLPDRVRQKLMRTLAEQGVSFGEPMPADATLRIEDGPATRSAIIRQEQERAVLAWHGRVVAGRWPWRLRQWQDEALLARLPIMPGHGT